MTETTQTDDLMTQDVNTLDVSTLTPLTPHVISRQATINIGTIGHVAHGKSTVVRAVSGVQTVRFKREKERNITIKLGYANAKIYKCDNPDCPAPACYRSFGSSKPDKVPCQRQGCGGSFKIMRHVSFVDCPGHDVLMATMLNGAAVMDAALMLIASNEQCPQPQTAEHLAAVEIMKLRHLIVLQNKVELITREEATDQQKKIADFLKGTGAEKSPVIPLSAVLGFNIDVLCEYIVTQIPIPIRDFSSAPQMVLIRSFDVNKPGEDIHNLKGGVAGGSIIKGVIKIGDMVEILPGIVSKQKKYKPIRSQVVSLLAEQNSLQYAVPGGLIGVGTRVDPYLSRADRLTGQVLGHPEALPPVYLKLTVKFYLLRRLLGVRANDRSDKKAMKVKKLATDEYLLVNVGSKSVGAQVVSAEGQDTATMLLMTPVCTRVGDKVAISRRVDKNWRLIGWGEIASGTCAERETI